MRTFFFADFQSNSSLSSGVVQHYTDYHPIRSSRNSLLIIDPQKDFHPGGSLAIASAGKDAAKIAKLIDQHSMELDDIVVSLDTHQKMHIAHPLFWKDPKSGKHPDPMTHISLKSLEAGEWTTTDPKWAEWGKSYVATLETNERFQLIVWPEHCLIGTNGHSVVDDVNASLLGWAEKRARAVEYVLKGHNMLTEHYSAFKADVVRADDARTDYNMTLLARLLKADRVIVCGQALSHCVAFSTRDLLSRWPKGQERRIVLLTDCASPVPGFEDAAKAFVQEMKAAGVTVTTSTKLAWAETGGDISPRKRSKKSS